VVGLGGFAASTHTIMESESEPLHPLMLGIASMGVPAKVGCSRIESPASKSELNLISSEEAAVLVRTMEDASEEAEAEEEVEQPAMVGPVRNAGPPSLSRFFLLSRERAATASRRPTGRLRRG
jgi:hypothetical protein